MIVEKRKPEKGDRYLPANLSEVLYVEVEGRLYKGRGRGSGDPAGTTSHRAPESGNCVGQHDAH